MLRKVSFLLTTLALFAATIPAAAPAQAAAKELRFSVQCPISHRAQVDPIVAPYGVSAHVHEFFGNVGTTADPRYKPMLDNGTTCDFSGDTGAYWIPTLVNPDTGATQRPVQVLAYYRVNPAGEDEPVAAFPKNFRAVSFPGDYEYLCADSETYSTPQNCDGRPGHKQHPYGAGMRIHFTGICWDGAKDLETKRHDVGGHLVGRKDGDCPASHPIQLPKLTLNVRYGRDDITGWEPSSLAHGVDQHGDFWNTWDQSALSTLVRRCLDPRGPWARYTYTQWEARCNKVTDASFALGD